MDDGSSETDGTLLYLRTVQSLKAPIPGEESDDIESFLNTVDPAPEVVHPQPVPFDSPRRVGSPDRDDKVRIPRGSKLPPINRRDSNDPDEASSVTGSVASTGHVAPLIRPIRVAPAPAGSDTETGGTSRSRASSSNDSKTNLVDDMAKRNDGYLERDDTIEMKQNNKWTSALAGDGTSAGDKLVYSPPQWPDSEDFNHLRKWDSSEDVSVSLHQVREQTKRLRYILYASYAHEVDVKN